jgi:hypothetical protein
MPWSGKEELQRTKARLVREHRQRTLRRQRELLSPSKELYNSDSDSDTKPRHRFNTNKLDHLSSDTKPSHRFNTNKLDHLSKYKRDLSLSVCCVLILVIAANLLVWQCILLRRA